MNATMPTTYVHEYDFLEQLLYCLGENFPAPVTAAMLVLADGADSDDLEAAWQVWRAARGYRWNVLSDFVTAVHAVTGATAMICADCACAVWEDDSCGPRCESCDQDYTYCHNCESSIHYEDTEHLPDDDRHFCSSCFSDLFTYCDECEEWFNADEHDHEDECGCECCAPHLRFSFPANGHGTISQDEPLTVELPAGTIDAQGMKVVRNYLACNLPYYMVDEVLGAVGPTWQTKRGNFTRRLAREVAIRGEKLADGVLSEVGNLARQHSSNAQAWRIEASRDFNLSAADWYHEDSCYWGSYSDSRCALKQWGAVGLRSFDDRGEVTGRVWVQPVTIDMVPTHDALNAAAYVVFNGYGALEGYVAARIVAHLADMTYRKITLGSDAQFINNGAGYLVAPAAVCDATDSVYFDGEKHQTYDASTIARTMVVSA